MSLVTLNIPVRLGLRLLQAVERIADYCDRVSPPMASTSPPEPGLTIVSNADVLEEQTRENLRALGYKPDDIDAMVEEGRNDNA